MDNLNENIAVQEAEKAVAYESASNVDPVAQEVAELTGKSFSQGLAATIMAQFPITCYIAIFMGIAGMKKAKRAKALAAENGINAGGKSTAGKILSIVGLAYGAYMSAVWTFVGIFYAIYFLIFMILMITGV